IRAKKEPVPPASKGVEIEFKDISYTLPSGQVLLSNISSSARAGQLTAIMGPSGAGKSTLLDILAGKDKRGKITGSLTLDGVPFNSKDSSNNKVAYVDQDDLLLPSLTVRETLLFSAQLRLPESMPLKEKQDRVDQVLETLGLSHVANSRVGGFGMRGISGGERRRVSIGVELVTSPGILFLDEPTSGLDSYNAHAVVEALHNLAHVHNKTVVITVHQPRSDMFGMFDQVLVLAVGSTLYSGAGSNTAAYLRERGTPCPEGYNIADFLLDLAMEVSKDSGVDGGDQSKGAFLINIGANKGQLRKRLNAGKADQTSGAVAEVAGSRVPLLLSSSRPASGVRVGFLTQVTVMIGRSMKHLIRTPSLLVGHLAIAIIMGVFVGGVYYKSDSSISGVQNRLGSLFFVLSLVGFSSLSAIGSLAQERSLFIRERSNGYYGSMPYYISKFVCDIIPLRILPSLLMGTITFFMVGYDATGDHYPKFLVLLVLFSALMGLTCISLGVAMSDVGTATLVGAILILFKMLFAGLIISQDSIPQAIRWIQYISFFRYPYEGMVVNDLALLQITDVFDGTVVNLPAALILEKFGFNLDNYGQDLLITIVLFVALVAVTGILIDVRLRERR
ncbi:hypothetical protein HDU99_010950, partial [Rhizoclosmatium hyalinum]